MLLDRLAQRNLQSKLQADLKFPVEETATTQQFWMKGKENCFQYLHLKVHSTRPLDFPKNVKCASLQELMLQTQFLQHEHDP